MLKLIFYRTMTVFYIVMAFIFICFVDHHLVFLLLVGVSLAAAGIYSNLADDYVRDLTSNASEDRPE